MKKATFFLAIIAIALVSFKAHLANTWKFDGAHSNLHFSVEYGNVADIEGSFRIKEATMTTPGDDFDNAKITFVADAKTINTDNEKRDEHLKSPDFFDAEKYPDITFTSSSFKKDGKNKYNVTGDLTFHGVTKSVTMNAVAATGKTRDDKTLAGFKVSGIVKRNDFGIAPKMNGMLSDDVMIRANVRFTKGDEK